MKKTNLNMEMFSNVNQFTGIDRQNLIVEGDMDIYVPYVIKLLWFRAVHPKGMIKTNMSVSMEDIVKNRVCVFVSEVFDSEGNLLGMGHGSANVDEENFIEVAERRATGKALAVSGFTWHNGDFSNDVDIAKTQLSIYNKYIENGNFDIHDETVKMLYDDAMVSILPEGYSAAGKPIAALDSLQLANIAKNCEISNDGDPVINAKIRFIYQYQLIENESQKSPISEQNDKKTEQKVVKEKSEKQSRKGKKSKKDTVVDNSETNIMTDIDHNQSNKDVVVNSMKENEAINNSVLLIKNTKSEAPTVDAQIQAPAEEIYPDEVIESNDNTEESLIDQNKLDFQDDNEDFPFEAFIDGEAEEDTNLSAEESYSQEIEQELHKEEVLKEWGYTNEEELCADWKAHLTLVREKCASLNWTDEQATRIFIEEIPIYNNFLWIDKCEKDTVILLGDFLNTHKDEVIQVMNEGHFPLPTLRYPVNWYIANVWKVF